MSIQSEEVVYGALVCHTREIDFVSRGNAGTTLTFHLPGCLELKCYQGRWLQPPYSRSGVIITAQGYLGTRSEQWEGKVVSVAAHQTDRKAEAREARQGEDVIAGLR